MEKILRKSAIYSFFIGIGLGILFIKYEQVTRVNSVITETSYLSLTEYIIMLLKYGVVVSILGLLFGWYIYNKQK